MEEPTMNNNLVTAEVTKNLQNLAHTSLQTPKWEKRSIYTLPASLTALNNTAYSPQTVSFGPYHHGKLHLRAMEVHKQRAMGYCLKRTGKTVESFVQALANEVQELRDRYDNRRLDKSWEDDDSAFLQLMILDGIFMLETTYLFHEKVLGKNVYYNERDPVFSDHGKLHIMPHIMRDMIMLENQLPMPVLYKLFTVQNNGHEDVEKVNKLILGFWFPHKLTENKKFGTCLHVLGLYRTMLLEDVSVKKIPPPSNRSQSNAYYCKCWTSNLSHDNDANNNDVIRSAIELNEAGISFKKSSTRSLKDVSFRHGVLRLPPIVVDDATEAILLNLMALERFHVGSGNEVTSYVFFMDNIIDTDRDVALLHSKGIIQNGIGSDKAVAKLFNSLSKDIPLDSETDTNLGQIRMEVKAYCRKPWNEWRANLIHTYFRNPWALLTLIAAIILFALTIVQTVYTIYAYYKPNDSPPPPSPPPLSLAPPPRLAPPRRSPRPSRYN